MCSQTPQGLEGILEGREGITGEPRERSVGNKRQDVPEYSGTGGSLSESGVRGRSSGRSRRGSANGFTGTWWMSLKKNVTRDDSGTAASEVVVFFSGGRRVYKVQ